MLKAMFILPTNRPTDQPTNRIHKWAVEDGAVSIFMENAGRANGLYFDDEGNLLAAADENSEIWEINPEKEVSIAEDNLVQPNGIIGTSDGKTLYIADIGNNKTYSYKINPDGSLSEKNFLQN